MATSVLSNPASSNEVSLRFPTAPTVTFTLTGSSYTATEASNELGDSGSYIDLSVLSTADLSDLDRMHTNGSLSRNDSVASRSETPVISEENESGSARNGLVPPPQASDEPLCSAPALRQPSSHSGIQPQWEAGGLRQGSRPPNSSTGTESLLSADSHRKESGTEQTDPCRDELVWQLRKLREDNIYLTNSAQLSRRDFEEEQTRLQVALVDAQDQVSKLESSMFCLRTELASALDQVSSLDSSLTAVTAHRDLLQTESTHANTRVLELQNRFEEARIKLNASREAQEKNIEARARVIAAQEELIASYEKGIEHQRERYSAENWFTLLATPRYQDFLRKNLGDSTSVQMANWAKARADVLHDLHEVNQRLNVDLERHAEGGRVSSSPKLIDMEWLVQDTQRTRKKHDALQERRKELGTRNLLTLDDLLASNADKLRMLERICEAATGCKDVQVSD